MFRRLRRWLESLLPQRITAEEYTAIALKNFGGPVDGPAVMSVTFKDDVIGRYVRHHDGHKTFEPDKDVMMRHCRTRTELHRWIQSHKALAQVVFKEQS